LDTPDLGVAQSTAAEYLPSDVDGRPEIDFVDPDSDRSMESEFADGWVIPSQSSL
jgi:hypothetical protein